MGRPRILVTQPIHAEVAARLAAVGELDLHPGPEPLAPAELAARVAPAQAVMAFMTERFDAALLAAAPRLRVVAAALKGCDGYDLAAFRLRGVWLSTVPDLLSAPTAELAIALALGLGRHLLAGDARVRQGQFHGWRPTLYGQGLDGSTVLLAGLGGVGRAIAQRLAGFNCTLLGCDPGARSVPAGVERCTLAEGVPRADWVLLALPLDDSTVGCVDEALLRRARPGSLWVNVGRGSVVDEYALARLLASGHLGGYAADVFACEDLSLPGRPPRVPDGLRQQPRTLFTPHLGSAVRAARLAIEHRAADNLIAALQGRVPPDAL